MPTSIIPGRTCQSLHHFSRFPSQKIAYLLVCVALASTVKPAISQEHATQARSQYQIERANCFNGHSNEDRGTCLTEANAALAEKQRGRLDMVGAQYQKNASLRCQPLSDENRDACERRMRGEGTVTGSAEAGGIYRELVTQIPGQQPIVTNRDANRTDGESTKTSDTIK
jgi:hypothetical protein